VTKVYIARKQETTEKKLSLEEAIANIDYHITQTAADIRKTEVSMTEKNTRITEYQDLATTLALRIQNNRSVLLSYIANLYTEGSLIYDEDNSIDIFQMLILSDGKTDDASRDILYKSLVSILGQKFIEEYRSLIKEYNIIQSRIRDEVALLEVDKELLDRQKKTLISQRDYKGMLLEATKGREALYEQYIKDQMRTQEQVEQSWKDAANDYTVSLQKLLEQNGCQKEKKTGADIERCGDILAFYRNERALKKLEVSTGSENIMDWPIGV
jgi:septal ring factor EnvC (AmiA/AmiB activator)